MNRKKILNIAPNKTRDNSAATVKMVKDLEAKLGPHTKNNVFREIFEEFYGLSDVGNYKLAIGSSGIIFTGKNPNITFSQMNIAKVWEGGLRLQNKTLDLKLYGKRNFTICVVMQLWLNRSMSIKTIMSNGAYEKPHLIYDKTIKKLKLQTNGLRAGRTYETSITLLNSFNGKRVVFWLTKKGSRSTLTLNSSLASQSNFTFRIFSDDAIIHKVMYTPNFYVFDSAQFHTILLQEKLNGSYVM